MKSEFVEKLEEIVGKDWVVPGKEDILDYLLDETAPTVCPKPVADVVFVKSSTTQEVSSILKLANQLKVPVFPTCTKW
jgi:FAD/FMN-containing dehydrogenase